MLGSHGLIRFSRLRCPDICGYWPVYNEQRLWAQTVAWRKQLVNLVDFEAKASMLGVCTSVLPKHPRASYRSWSGMKMSRLGLEVGRPVGIGGIWYGMAMVEIVDE